VSHNPFAHPFFCLDAKGKEIEANDDNHNFFKMDHSKIQSYDVGLKKHPEFLDQKKYPAKIPLLSEVFDLLNNEVTTSFSLFLEIKSDQNRVGEFYPKAEEYAMLVDSFLNENEFKGQLIVKSFDHLFLNEFYRLSKNKYRLGLLVDNQYSVRENLSQLDFVPAYYNPEYIHVTKQMVEELHHREIQLVTWTVNEIVDYEQMIYLNVDGIISDHPMRFI
tara:strand:- start:179 stop:835 length:657 start_codon:yes stop_codon:yes gene_type:complete